MDKRLPQPRLICHKGQQLSHNLQVCLQVSLSICMQLDRHHILLLMQLDRNHILEKEFRAEPDSGAAPAFSAHVW